MPIKKESRYTGGESDKTEQTIFEPTQPRKPSSMLRKAPVLLSFPLHTLPKADMAQELAITVPPRYMMTKIWGGFV